MRKMTDRMLLEGLVNKYGAKRVTNVINEMNLQGIKWSRARLQEVKTFLDDFVKNIFDELSLDEYRMRNIKTGISYMGSEFIDNIIENYHIYDKLEEYSDNFTIEEWDYMYDNNFLNTAIRRYFKNLQLPKKRTGYWR